MGLLESQNPRRRSKRTRRRRRTRVVIGDRSARRLVEQVVGEGWLTHGAVRLGQVSYAIDVWRIERSWDPGQDGTQLDVHLTHHTATAPKADDALLTLHLEDGRTLGGFLSADGSRFVRTGPLQTA